MLRMLEEQIVEPCLVDSAPEIYWRFLPQTRDIKSGAWMVVLMSVLIL